MAEGGWGENPYPDGTIQHWVWDRFIGPRVNYARVQFAISEKQLANALENNWAVVSQLKSGGIIVEKQFSATEVMEAGMNQMKLSAAEVMKRGMKQVRANAAKELG